MELEMKLDIPLWQIEFGKLKANQEKIFAVYEKWKKIFIKSMALFKVKSLKNKIYFTQKMVEKFLPLT